jgi:rhamnogalacturonyl hydrolase YesR
MRKTKLVTMAFTICMACSACSSPSARTLSKNASAGLPAKDKILADMTVANKYFMDKWPDPGAPIVTDKKRPSNIWTRGTYYEGLMALYEVKPDLAYYDYAVAWGEAHNWNLQGNWKTRHADDHCAGQTYIDLYSIDPKPERIATIKQSIDAMVASDKCDDWWWIDALQMAMPVYAKLGVVYEDDRYFEKMYDLYNYTKTKHGDNGWVFAALVRVLDIMPADAPHRDEYLKTYKEMAAALLPIQRPDGFWNVSLHDPTNFGGPELSGTAFFTYGFAWGVRKGILDEATYLPAAIKGWNGMVNDSLHPNGFLGWVQGTGKQPSDGQPLTYDKVPNFEDYGLGAFLLAGSEMAKLTGMTVR